MRQQGCAQGTKRCHVAHNGTFSVQAALLPRGSMDRLLVVAAFAQSGFAAGLRPYKCLNPVMGETFEVCGTLIPNLHPSLLQPTAGSPMAAASCHVRSSEHC